MEIWQLNSPSAPGASNFCQAPAIACSFVALLTGKFSGSDVALAERQRLVALAERPARSSSLTFTLLGVVLRQILETAFKMALSKIVEKNNGCFFEYEYEYEYEYEGAEKDKL